MAVSKATDVLQEIELTLWSGRQAAQVLGLQQNMG